LNKNEASIVNRADAHTVTVHRTLGASVINFDVAIWLGLGVCVLWSVPHGVSASSCGGIPWQWIITSSSTWIGEHHMPA